jgi:hypothetical protein
MTYKQFYFKRIIHPRQNISRILQSITQEEPQFGPYEGIVKEFLIKLTEPPYTVIVDRMFTNVWGCVIDITNDL